MNASRYEMDLILDIANRAADEFKSLNRPVSHWVMDIESVHTNDMPLRLPDIGVAFDALPASR